jgi:hypothetical protein
VPVWNSRTKRSSSGPQFVCEPARTAAHRLTVRTSYDSSVKRILVIGPTHDVYLHNEPRRTRSRPEPVKTVVWPLLYCDVNTSVARILSFTFIRGCFFHCGRSQLRKQRKYAFHWFAALIQEWTTVVVLFTQMWRSARYHYIKQKEHIYCLCLNAVTFYTFVTLFTRLLWLSFQPTPPSNRNNKHNAHDSRRKLQLMKQL